MSCLGPFRHAKTILDVFIKNQTYRFESKKRGILSCDTCPLSFVRIELLASSVERQQQRKNWYLSFAEITTDGYIYMYSSFVGLKFCTNGLHHCIYFASLSNPHTPPHPPPPPLPLCACLWPFYRNGTHTYKKFAEF
jgi:hypothetical protein